MKRLILVFITVLLVSCSDGPSGHRSTTVVYASGADLQSINPLVTVHPLAKAVQKHVLFLTLAAYDSLFRPVPRLADWVWNEARTSLTFSLRPDVRWHDGTTTGADDVVWTLEMAREPAVAYPRARDLAGVIDVRALDSITVRVTFSRPQPAFPDVFTDLPILPARQFASSDPMSVRSDPFNHAPVGNGPFEFVEYRPNQRWVFERSDMLPADLGRPEIERFVVVVVDEPATKLAALTSGELDFAGISPAHATFVQNNESLYTIDYPVQFVYALVWNLRRSPFDDLRVRRALTMAIDRQLIIEAYLYGYGTPANGPVPPEHPWNANVPAVPYDRHGAASLLDQAGWGIGEDGVRKSGSRRLTIDLLTVGSGDVPLEQMIQAQLREVGVEVDIHQHELSSFLALAQAQDRDYDALVIGVPGDLSLSHVAAMFGGQNSGPLAYPGYRSVRFDELIEAAGRASTEAAVKQAWQGALQVLSNDLPTTWLYHARGLQGANHRITNTSIDFRGELAGISRWRIRRPN
jgi:peptide/nickel transport system substrate-binding protein